MNKEEFVEAIKLVVVEGAIKGVESILLNPPGRQPDPKLLESSAWFKELNQHDKEMVMKIVARSVDMGVFSFLCVLDGVRVIEDWEERGQLILNYEKNGNSTWLNNPNDGDYLHDLL